MIRVRFAPSPTGYLHIGNVRTALFNYLFSRRNNGVFILRIEDTDKERSRQDFIEHIYEDLSWLGIAWDEGPDKGGAYGPYIQSERYAIYQRYAAQLIAQKKAYYCFCSEEDLDVRRKEQIARGETPRYDNRCRELSDTECAILRARGIAPSIRFKVDNRPLVVHDIVRGDVTFDLSIVGDFVIVRPDGSPTFHLAVCVDDGCMQITHVIRGEDHLSNTPRHVLIFEACGFQVPHFAHMPLTMGPGGEPLSKRLGAMSIAEYRKKGYVPEALCNYMALLGWSSGDDREFFSLDELKNVFSLERVSRSAAIFDKTKMEWMCGEHIRTMDDEEYVARSTQYMIEEGIVARTVFKVRPEWYKKVVLVFKNYLSSFSELAGYVQLFDETAVYTFPPDAITDGARDVLAVLRDLLNEVELLDEEAFDGIFKELKKRTKRKGKELFMPVRLALTGALHGPELKLIVPLLGKTMCAVRIQNALESLGKKEQP